MKSSSLLLFLSLFLTSSFAQTYVNELSPRHTSGMPRREAAFSFVDSTSKTLYLTYVTKNKMYLNTYQDFKKTMGLDFDRTEDPGLFNQINAAVLKKEEGVFSLLFSNPTYATFSVLHIQVQTKTVERKAISIDLKENELFLNAFSKEHSFYVVVLLAKSSVFKLYEYDTRTDKVTSSLYDFSHEISNLFGNKLLWDIVRKGTGNLYQINWYRYMKNTYSVSPLDPEVVSRRLKFSLSGNQLRILVDNDNTMTLLLGIHLLSKERTFETLEKEQRKVEGVYTKSNSFLFEDKLIQVKISPEVLSIRVMALDAKQILTRFACSVEDKVIPFANTPISKSTKGKGVASPDSKSKSINVKRFFLESASYNIFVGATRNKKGK